MNSQEFTFRDRMKSFRYAFEGIASFFARDHNAWVHCAATVIVLVLAFVLKVNKTELLALVFAIGFVWVAEMFNTCIEKVMDFVSIQRRPEIRFIKDVAAGAVLVASITASIVGAIVFIPKFFTL